MIRRHVAIAAVALAGVVSMSSCATFDRNDDVAVVGDDSLTRADLATLLEAFSADAGVLKTATIVDGVADGDLARSVISEWVRTHIAENELVAQGVPITQADRDAVRASYQSQAGFTELTPVVSDFIIESAANSSALNDISATDPAMEARLRAQDVFVDSRYGSWNPGDLSVLPLR